MSGAEPQKLTNFLFTFIAPQGFSSHPKTRAHVALLDPCSKTGQMKPPTANSLKRFQVNFWGGAPEANAFSFHFHCATGFSSHPKTRAHVALLGPCSKTGQMKPPTANSLKRSESIAFLANLLHVCGNDCG